MITKWYPNADDPQFGVFIQKHAKAIALNHSIAVLYVHPGKSMQDSYSLEVTSREDFTEIVSSYRRSNHAFGAIINPFRYLRALSAGLRTLRKQGSPDIIHAYILNRPALAAYFLSKKYRVPYLVSEQWSGFLTGKFLQSSILKKWLSRLLVKNAKAVTAVSSILRKKMIKHGLSNENFHVVPNTIEKTIQHIELPESKVVNVLLVADLVDKIKNVSGVINMLATTETGNEYHLRIIGHGPDRKFLQQLAEEHGLSEKISFEGLKNNSEVYEYLGRCDFLIMNSNFETFSLICAEAMCCGKPVLATKCGGPEEFVNEQTGILVEPGNKEELAAKFTFMIKNYKSFNSESIKKYATERFSGECIGAMFHEIYRKALS